MDERLREALKFVDAGNVALENTEALWALNEIYRAARRFLALTETGPDYEAARKKLVHRMSLPGGVTPEGDIKDIVDAALADYLTEDTPTP